MIAGRLRHRLLALACSLATLVALVRPASAQQASDIVPLRGGEIIQVAPNAVPDDVLDAPIVDVRVEVKGRKFSGRPTLRRMKKGERFSPALLRDDLREVLDSGRFADARGKVEKQGDGVIVIVEVVPRRTVGSIAIEGGALEDAPTIEAMKLAVGSEVTEDLLGEARGRVLDYYRRRGYVDARVEIRPVELDDPNTVQLSVRVEPGDARLVSQRVFVITPEEDALVGDLKAEYEVEADDVVDEEVLEVADRELAELLRSKGFYKATVTHRTRHVGPFSYIYVYLLAGPFLNVRFEGQHAFDEDELRDIVGAGNKGLEIDDATQRLRKHYVEYGFYDVSIQMSIVAGIRPGIETLDVRIHEGARVRVKRRVFVCLPKDLDPDDVGDEIDSFLEEALPDGTSLEAPSPTILEPTIGPTQFSGGRQPTLTVSAASTYDPETYGKALRHLRELYLSRGYLNAIIGPVEVSRARCDKHSPAGTCRPLPLPPVARPKCELSDEGLPVPEPSLPPASTCTPSLTGTACAPEVELRIAMHLGKQASLYDVVFEGSRLLSEKELSEIAALELGGPLDVQAIEEAKRRLQTEYENRGYAFAEVRDSIETSRDKTRARVRFSIRDRDLVTISDVVVRGAVHTDEQLILGRISLTPGEPYSRASATESEERIATLGIFSSVSIALEDPDVPEKQKRLIVTVVEVLPQYLDPKIGFSTGEGVRFGLEYGHRNIGGLAIGLTLRVQLNYLFDFMIFDDDLKRNLEPLSASERLERRNSAKISFPEIGLGPLFSAALEGVDIRDNQRDFGLTRDAFVPSITFRPVRELQATLSTSLELNDVTIFNNLSLNEAILENPALERLLRFPDGRTFAVAERITASWDRRDNPFAATRGTFLGIDVEHVNAFPADPDDPDTDPIVSHFMKVGGRVAGYVRLTERGLALAFSFAAATNIQLASGSRTYPDRLLYMGGFDSLRSFLVDSLIPEDVMQRILNPPRDPAQRITVDDVAVRGGDLSINPRIELRVPLNDTFQIGLFADAGNVWVDPEAFSIALRFGLGGGLRVNTPIGPLALDYGFNPERRPGEDLGALHFSIGLF